MRLNNVYGPHQVSVLEQSGQSLFFVFPVEVDLTSDSIQKVCTYLKYTLGIGIDIEQKLSLNLSHGYSRAPR